MGKGLSPKLSQAYAKLLEMESLPARAALMEERKKIVESSDSPERKFNALDALARRMDKEGLMLDLSQTIAEMEKLEGEVEDDIRKSSIAATNCLYGEYTGLYRAMAVAAARASRPDAAAFDEKYYNLALDAIRNIRTIEHYGAVSDVAVELAKASPIDVLKRFIGEDIFFDDSDRSGAFKWIEITVQQTLRTAIENIRPLLAD